jgi:undecaprenyl diphosphate synthase
VDTLMGLLQEYLRKELQTLAKNDIRFRVIGRMADLAEGVQDELRTAIDGTAENRGMVFNIALSYGGRAEMVDACRALMRDGLRPEEVDEAALARRLYTAGLPDPDLLIRTSGEMRVSNFLLWQIAYAEIWVTPTLWPDFRRRHLLEAILDYQRRERRFGGVHPGEPAAAVRS